jgi:hypothetical protein
MFAARIILSIFLAIVSRLFFRPSYSFHQFPEMIRSPTCLHLQTPSGRIHSPAYMVFPQGSTTSPVFMDLYTNRTAVAYRNLSFKKIYMTSPVYQRRSLHRTLVIGRSPYQQAMLSPAILRILENRNATWWHRCDRHWRELQQR